MSNWIVGDCLSACLFVCSRCFLVLVHMLVIVDEEDLNDVGDDVFVSVLHLN